MAPRGVPRILPCSAMPGFIEVVSGEGISPNPYTSGIDVSEASSVLVRA